VLEAHLTIIQQVVVGDEWGSMAIPVISAYPRTAFVFVASLLSIQFAMLNLIMTVIVDSASRSREEDEKQLLLEKRLKFEEMKDKLVRLCGELDKDGSGELGLSELMKGYESNAAFEETMQHMSITPDDMETMFMVMDEDRSGNVSYVEFVNNIYRMKEQDINTTLMFIKGYLVDVRAKIKDDVSKQLKHCVSETQSVAEHIRGMVGRMESTMSSADTTGKDIDMRLRAILSTTVMEQLVKQDRNVQRLGVDLTSLRSAVLATKGAHPDGAGGWCRLQRSASVWRTNVDNNESGMPPPAE
jgi:hypothetical protein